MLTHPTIEQLRALKLDGMAEAFIELQAQDTARDLAHAEWLALLLDREAASRSTRRYRTRLRDMPSTGSSFGWPPFDCLLIPAIMGFLQLAFSQVSR
jgi:hypothetical protein